MKSKNETVISAIPEDLKTILRNFLLLNKQLHDQTADHRDCDVVGTDAICRETQNVQDEISNVISNSSGIVYTMQKLVGDADDLSSFINHHRRSHIAVGSRDFQDLSLLINSHRMYERVHRLSEILDQYQCNDRLQALCGDRTAMEHLMDELPEAIDRLSVNLEHIENRVDHLQQAFERSKRHSSGGGRRIQFDEEFEDTCISGDKFAEKADKTTMQLISRVVQRQTIRQHHWGQIKKSLRQSLRPCLSFALFDAVTKDQGQPSFSYSSLLQSSQLQRAKRRFSSPLRPVSLRRPENEQSMPSAASAIQLKKEQPPVTLLEMERDFDNLLDRQLRYTFRVVRPPSPPPPPPAPAPSLPIAPTLPDVAPKGPLATASAPTLTIPQPPAQQQATRESLAAEAERRLTAVYQATEPDKVKKIPALLAKYKGREEELIASIEKKFGPGAGSSGGNSTAAPQQQQPQQQSQLFKSPLSSSQPAQGLQPSQPQKQQGGVGIFGSTTTSGTTTPSGFGGSGTTGSVFNIPKSITSQPGKATTGSSLYGSPSSNAPTGSTGFGGGFGGGFGAAAAGGVAQPSSLFGSPAKQNVPAMASSGASPGIGFGQSQGFGQGWGQQQGQQQGQGQIMVSADTARRRLMELYTMHNPSKIAEIPGLLEKYRGKEAELLAKAEKRYGPLTQQLQQQQQQQPQTQFGGGFGGGIAAAPTPFGVGSSLFQNRK